MRLRAISESMNIISIDHTNCPENCEYCNQPGDLRPYGKDGAWICFQCGMDNEEETEAAFNDVLAGKSDNGVKIVSLTESIKPSKLVKARDLSVGDELSFGGKVIVAPSAGLKTPSGKVDLMIEYPNGQRCSKTWNKNTEISIKIKE